MTVTVTRWSQSCVRLDGHGRSLLIDPGEWTEDATFDGVDAVLLTHDHPDHADPTRIGAAGCPVIAPAGSVVPGVDLEFVAPGSSRDAVGFHVDVVGGEHARVVDDVPLGANVGYVVDGWLYHPGDALHLPHVPVDLLFVPVHGTWLKLAEAVAFVRAVAPRRSVGMHDGQLNELGLASVNRWLAAETDGWSWYEPGAVVDDVWL